MERGKFILYFLFVVFFSFGFFGSVDALEIGISPSEMDFSLDEGEEKCFNFILLSDKDISFDISVLWSDSKSRKIEDYKAYSAEKNINFSHKSLNKTDDERNYQACLSGNDAGKYYGVLIAKVLERNAAVGMWIELDVNGGNVFDYLGFNSDTSREKDNSEIKEEINPVFFLLLSTSFLLTLFLLMMIFYVRKTKRRLEE